MSLFYIIYWIFESIVIPKEGPMEQLANRAWY